MAGNKELIDEIVDPIAVKQVDELKAHILSLEASFVTAAKQAANLNAKAAQTSGLSKFNAAADKSAIATQRLLNLQTQRAVAEAKLQDVEERRAARKEAIYNKEIAAAAKIQAAEDAKTKTIISNSQDEIDAYEKSRQGQENITTTVSKRNKIEAQAANESAARSAKTLKQQADQAKEYVRAQGLIEATKTKLERYKILAEGATNPEQLQKYNKKIQETQTVITQLSNVGKEGFDSLGNAVKKSSNLFQTIGQKVVTLARILPGIGVVGLIAFATEPILNYISTLDIFKGKVSSAAENLKNINDVFTTANKEAGQQSTNLKILYQATTDVNNSMKRRIDAARELQQEFPTTFGLQTKENIINGEASGIYNQLTADILTNARAKAAAAKVSDIAAKQLDEDFQQQKIRIAQQNELIKSRKTEANGGFDVEGGGILAGENERKIKERADNAIKLSNIRKKSLKDQADFLIKFVGGNNKIAEALGNGDGGKAEEAAAKKAAAEAKKRADEASKAEDEAQKRAFDDRIRALQAEIKLQEEANKEEADLRKKSLDDATNFENDANNKRLILNDKIANEEYALLQQQYKDRLISEQEFQQIKQDIERESALRSIDSAIVEAENLIEIQRSFGKDTQAEEDKLAALKIKRGKLVLDNTLSDIEKEKAARKSLNELTKQVEQEAFNFIVTLVNAGFENRKNKIQDQINLTDENAKAEIDAVNRSLLSTSDKADKVKLIEAQADAQKKQLQREQKRVDQEKAKFDKAVSIARIIEATAIAEIQALSYLSNPITAPLYPGIAGLIAALGAIQLATVLATPIPAYEKGTRNAKGGTSLVGEKGAEYVITPQGATFLTPNKPTLMDIPKGSTVIPHLQTARMMDVQKYAGGQAVDMSEVVRAIERNRPVKSKTVINGWLQESRASSANQKRRNDYFN